MCRCDDTKRNRDQQLKREGNHAHDKGKPDNLVELFDNGNCPYPAVTEVTFEELHEPCKESGNDIKIHTVSRLQLRQPFLIGF